MGKRPNFLFITADQHRGDCFGFAGRRVSTPHLDEMARGGTVFSACMTVNPICQPARASMLTGLLPRTHGVSDNGIDLDPALGQAGFAGRLSGAGYRTSLIGKAHFATSHNFQPSGTPECRDSMQHFGPDWHGPYMGFDHVELVVEGHNAHLPLAPPNGQHYERWYDAGGQNARRNAMYESSSGRDTLGAPQTWHSGLPPAFHNSSWVGDRTIAQLNQVAERAEPFCIWASFPDPHHPFDCPLPWSLLHDPAQVDLPEHRSRDLDRRPWWHRATLEGDPQIRADMAAFRTRFSRVPELDDAQLREVIANYYGMVSLIDHNVGRIMAELHRLGLDENTIVIYSADHGDWLGDHGLLLKGPMMYEGLLRVGCIFQRPGVPVGKEVADPVSNLDFAATFLDYAGLARPAAMHSQSLRPLIETDSASRDFAFSEWELRPTHAGTALQLHTIRTATHKLTVDQISKAGELYDLMGDPFEMNSVFNDPEHAAIRAELESYMAQRPDDALPVPLPQTGMA
ncbi:sulfatase-like hydrolase/transferase [Yoonia sp. BS5-3]|uniref:Sulfatase-like hydrolase/transferase n=1 Tax=Yoonia phaeophyticola TaxID=3137369 RepID=A0ABZ2V3T2_9RHOB